MYDVVSDINTVCMFLTNFDLPIGSMLNQYNDSNTITINNVVEHKEGNAKMDGRT